ncbi:MAG: hypothetical protein JSS02_29355 [Planctomycetes bacterium]|nr:hypothetical protein [Planctomycetota bacterium]
MKSQSLILFVAGLILGWATWMYALQLSPHLIEDLVEISVRPRLVGAINSSLQLGGVALAVLSATILVEAVRSWQGLPVSRVALLIQGGALVATGIMLLIGSGNHHALGYSLIGLLLLTAIVVKT